MQFLPFMVEDEDGVEVMLKNIAYFLKDYLDGLIQKDKYIEYLDFRELGMIENNEAVSIKKDDILNNRLTNNGQVPFYIHGKELRFIDAIHFLEEQLNDKHNTFGEELEGLVINVREHYTTFDSIRPSINSTDMYVEFIYNKYYKMFKLVIRTAYDYPLDTTIERLNNSTDIFSFSLDNDKEFRPFIELLEHTLRFPEAGFGDIYKSQLEEEIARLIVSSIVFNNSGHQLGCEPFSLEELRLLFNKHTDIEICLGTNNTFDVYREIVPIIADNVMLTGKINKP